MIRNRQYYLGRVHKGGVLTEEQLVSALRIPVTIVKRNYAWTFTDTHVEEDGNGVVYVYSKLNKFHPHGSVTVIDEEHRTQDERPEPNLLIASSPFVYIPAFSGVAYQHVWNQIQREIFVKRFSDIVCCSYSYFLVDCEIEPITDLRSFAAKLASIETFLEIQAKVHPPNPLFGRAWAHLRDYLESRSAQELNVKEKSDERTPLRTEVVRCIQELLAEDAESLNQPSEPIPLTDAAILMAADGYGNGKVIGRDNGALITLRTSETQKSFLFDADPESQALYGEARQHLSSISDERHMRH